MPANIVWEGIDAFNKALLDHVERENENARRFVSDGLHLAQTAMQQRAGEGGRHAKGTPTPATPGGGPAVISGDHRRSIHVGPIEPTGFTGWAGEVGPSMIYSRRIELEYGYLTAQPGWADAIPQIVALARTRLGVG